MIPQAHITHWRAHAPWPSDAQVEQDLILSRILVHLFEDPLLRDAVAFRGGTALHKLYCHPPARYSEDIDLVQIPREPIGRVAGRIREVLQPLLGNPSFRSGGHGFTYFYRYVPEDPAVQSMRIKIEINGREHESRFGHAVFPHAIESPWFTGACEITTFALEELLGTKLRALHQRRKGRDLFDLHHARQAHAYDDAAVIDAFLFYLRKEGRDVRRDEFARTFREKLAHKQFLADVRVLLRRDIPFDLDEAASYVLEVLLPLIPA